MLKQGDKAPQFKLKNQEGKTIELSQFLGQKVVVYFYPKDDTPGCTREAIDFTQEAKRFSESNTVILGISKDSVASHATFCNKYNLKVDLLSDEDGAVTEAFGAWQEKKNYGKTYMGIVRSTFLIDEKGVITKSWNNVKVDGHIESILKELA